jgi:hypothetical protein
METKKSKVELGRIVATPGAIEPLVQSGEGEDGRILFFRHASCDWGEVCEPDCDEDEFEAETFMRLCIVSRPQDGSKGCIITDADRTVTMILLDPPAKLLLPSE